MGKNSPAYPPDPVLLVDDEQHTLASFDIALRTHGINNTLRCPDSRKVISILESRPIEVVLLDLMMPHLSGYELLGEIKRRFPEIPVIVITGVNEVETAVRCLREGAFDYLLKPVEIERLLPGIKRALEITGLRRDNARLASTFFVEDQRRFAPFSGIITNNGKMKALFRYCGAIAESSQPVLISGESGTGKERIARAIHELSGRSGDYVTVNAAGLDDHIFADTLFGHARGAFTGAEKTRAGLVEKAASGSLFLDEIGDLSESSQIKLLRLLEEREYYPLGSDLAHCSDARIIVATHHDLETRQQQSSFRRDLYYRLRTHRIQIPPLRERKDDIPALLDFFLGQAANELGRKKPDWPKELVPLLAAYDFPGNVRELRALAYEAVSHLAGDVVALDFFKQELDSPGHGFTTASSPEQRPTGPWAAELLRLPTLKEADQALIAEALKRSGNNQRAAAALLGISPQALSQRLRRQP